MKTIATIFAAAAIFAAGYAAGVSDADTALHQQLTAQTAPRASIEQREALCDTDTDCQEKFGGDGY